MDSMNNNNKDDGNPEHFPSFVSFDDVIPSIIFLPGMFLNSIHPC